jgi:Raf kinase inhibitor-like YbhB/YbcL family protein
MSIPRAFALFCMGATVVTTAGSARTASASGELTIRSPAFADGGEIPRKYTCEGEDAVPPLSWSGVPAGAKSLVLIVDDPDVPDPAAPKRMWVHWVVYDIPPDSDGIAEGGATYVLPRGAKEGTNDWKRTRFGGPCPPIGRHRYFHKLYALDTTLEALTAPTKAELEAAMQGHVLAGAVLVGTYEKAKKPAKPQ